VDAGLPNLPRPAGGVPVGNSILLATDIESGDAPALCERSIAYLVGVHPAAAERSPAKLRFDRIRPAFPPWSEAVAVGVTAAQGTTPQGLWGLGAGPCRLHGGSTTDPSAAYAPRHATGGGIVSRGRCGGTTENEFNGIGGAANLHQDCAGTRHLSDWRAHVLMQEIYAITAVVGAVIALVGAYSLWALEGPK
jgi:hypothetical protein